MVLDGLAGSERKRSDQQRQETCKILHVEVPNCILVFADVATRPLRQLFTADATKPCMPNGKRRFSMTMDGEVKPPTRSK